MKWLPLLLALAVPSCAQKLSEEGFHVNQFGGLDTFHETSGIADTDASDAQNVFTDKGYLTKPGGNLQLGQVLNGYPVHFLAEFVAPSKTRYIIAASSSTVYATDLSAGFVAIGTCTLGYTLDGVSAYGNFYIVNGYDAAWYWDGTSSGTATGVPACAFIDFADERLYCAAPAAADYRVYASGFGDVTDWTVPAELLADSPATFDFQRTDGEGITCFAVSPYGKFIGKRHSTHYLKGFDNSSIGSTGYSKHILDSKIGCIDDRSVQMVDGLLTWLSENGVYQWGGYGAPVYISKDIEPTVEALRQQGSNSASWKVSTQSEFEAGEECTSGPNSCVSTTITPASIVPSSTAVSDEDTADFLAGTLVDVSTNVESGALAYSTASAFISNGGFASGSTSWTLATGGVGVATIAATCDGYLNGNACAQMTSVISNGGSCNANSYRVRILDASDDSTIYDSAMTRDSSIHLEAIEVSTYTAANLKVQFECRDGSPGTDTGKFTSDSFAKPGSGRVSYRYVAQTCAATSITLYVDDVSTYPRKGYFTSRTFDMAMTTPTFGSLDVAYSTSADGTLGYTFRAATSASGDWPSWTVETVATKITAPPNRYAVYAATWTVQYATSSAILRTVSFVGRTTAYYLTPVHFVGTAITAWKQFDATEDTSEGGTAIYWVRTATETFTRESSTPAWVSQTNHITVADSTGSYLQGRSLFGLASGTNSIAIGDFNYAWTEGTAVPVASMVHDHRYWLCAQISSTSVINDGCLVYQKNSKWVPISGPSYGALSLYSNYPIAGDGGTDSHVWKIMQDDISRYDTSAIDSYWVTKDFTFNAPNQDKVLNEIWIDAEYSSGTILNVGYSANKSSTFVTKGSTLSYTTDYINQLVPLDEGFALGKYFRFKFSNSTIDQSFRLSGYSIYGEVKPRTRD